jgi:hypothetical protein
VGGAAVIGLLTGIAATAIALRVQSRDAAEGPRHFAVALPDSAPFVAAHERFGLPMRSLAVSRDGRQLVYNAAIGAGTRLYRVRLDAGTLTPVAGSENARLPVFSPDGRQLAFVVADTEIRRASLDEGTWSRVTTTIDPQALVWLGDDRLYFTEIDCLRSVPASGGPAVNLPGHSCGLSWLIGVLAPVGDRSDWLFVTMGSHVRLFSTRTGEMRELAPHGRGLRGDAPQLVANRYLTVLRDSTLFAAPFDPRRFAGVEMPDPKTWGVRGGLPI